MTPLPELAILVPPGFAGLVSRTAHTPLMGVTHIIRGVADLTGLRSSAPREVS
jgi:hypothetical protein